MSEARNWLSKALESGVARDTALRGRALNAAGAAAALQCDLQSGESLLEERIALERERGDKAARAQAFHNLGTMLLDEGPQRATVLFEESLGLEEELGHTEGVAYSLGGLANAESHLGRVAEAKSLWERSLSLHADLGDTRSVALTLHNLSEAARVLGDLEEAPWLSAQSIRLFNELQDCPLTVEALRNVVELLGKVGNHVAVARMLGASEAVLESVMPNTAPGSPERGLETLAARARSVVSTSAFETARREGKMMPLERAVWYPLEAVDEIPHTNTSPKSTG